MNGMPNYRRRCRNDVASSDLQARQPTASRGRTAVAMMARSANESTGSAGAGGSMHVDRSSRAWHPRHDTRRFGQQRHSSRRCRFAWAASVVPRGSRGVPTERRRARPFRAQRSS